QRGSEYAPFSAHQERQYDEEKVRAVTKLADLILLWLKPQEDQTNETEEQQRQHLISRLLSEVISTNIAYRRRLNVPLTLEFKASTFEQVLPEDLRTTENNWRL